MDRIRALVTGRPGTPYALGCFLFDIYIPNSYPHDPPVVNFITTGGRTVRYGRQLIALVAIIGIIIMVPYL